VSLGGLTIDDRTRRVLDYVAVALIVIGFVNFFWFIAEAISRGDALSGKVVDGHYFLGNKGTYTEVDQATWEWSRLHGLSLFVTHPLAIAAIFYLNFRRVVTARRAATAAGEQRSPTGETTILGLEPRLGAVIEILGLGVGVVLVAMGVLWAIPKLGFPGLAWTIGAMAILLWNGARVLRRRRSVAPPAASLPTIALFVATAAVVVGLLTLGMGAVSGPPSGRADVVPQAPAGRQVFLAPMGATSVSALQALASFYSARYGLSVTVLPAAPIIPRDPSRGQINAEGLVAVLQSTYAEASNPNDVVIGVVGDDMYAPARPDWNFSFGIYGDHLAVISTWRMEAGPGPFSGIQSSARLRKFVTRYIGFVYFGLPASTDPHSVLFDPVLGLDDLDRMGEDY
jgi:hypothetical protein